MRSHADEKGVLHVTQCSHFEDNEDDEDEAEVVVVAVEEEEDLGREAAEGEDSSPAETTLFCCSLVEQKMSISHPPLPPRLLLIESPLSLKVKTQTPLPSLLSVSSSLLCLILLPSELMSTPPEFMVAPPACLPACLSVALRPPFFSFILFLLFLAAAFACFLTALADVYYTYT